MSDTEPDVPEGYQPPLAHGGLFVDPNWSPRLSDRLGSVRTDTGVMEHWAQDLAPVMYPHLPNSFWREVPLGPEPPEGPTEPEVTDPVLTSIDPSGAPVQTEVTATVTGENFIEGTACFFGGFGQPMAWASVTAWTPTTLTVTVPALDEGTWHVSVETGTGHSSTLENAFTVENVEIPANPEPLTVTDITPTQGPTGTVVFVNGTGFTHDASTSWTEGGTVYDAPATVLSDTRITTIANMSFDLNSTWDITVKTALGTATLPNAFRMRLQVDDQDDGDEPEVNQEMTEYEMDQMWGIGEAEPPPEA